MEKYTKEIVLHNISPEKLGDYQVPEKDTDGNGITDANEDFDRNRLTNQYELCNGINLWDSDTDSVH